MKDKIKKDQYIASITRKATSPDPTTARHAGMLNGAGAGMAKQELVNSARGRARKINSAERLYQALPELEMIVSVRTATILSSKDLVTTALIYNSENEIPMDLNSKMVEVIRDHFEKKIELPKRLYKWIKSAQRTQGAVPVVMLSDSGFDEMFRLAATEARKGIPSDTAVNSIKSTFEKQRGILRPLSTNDKKVGVESLFSENVTITKPQSLTFDLSSLFGDVYATQNFDVTDNTNITKYPELQRKVAGERAKANYFTGGSKPYESKLKGVTGAEDLINKNSDDVVNPNYDSFGVQQIYAELPRLTATMDNKTDGMFTELSAAGVVPVRLGQNSEPIGYIALLEKNGHVVSENSANSLESMMTSLPDNIVADEAIRNAAQGMGTNHTPNNRELVDMCLAKYSDIAEKQMRDMLSSGLGIDDAVISATNDFYKIMLARHLAKANTQILYIPAENMAYFAVDFNENGVGVSIAEKSFVISTVRMALLFATMNAATANSSRHMQYNIETMPDDMNAQETVARAVSDIMNTHNSNEPAWGNMADAYALATNANIAFNVTGNEYYAPYQVGIEDNTPDYKMPDAQYDADLLRKTCNLAGVDPDLVMTPENIEFATQIFSKSLIVLQQTILIQEALSQPLKRFVYGTTISSRSLLEEIGKVAYRYHCEAGLEPADARKTAIENLYEFLEGLSVKIPHPDTSLGNAQLEQFQARVEYYTKLSEFAISDDIARMIENEGVAVGADELRSMLVSYSMITWCRKNGIDDNFFKMFEPENYADHVKAMSDEVRDRSKFLMALSKRVAKKVETVGNTLGDEDAGGDYGGGSSDMGGGDTSTDDENMDDEFSLDEPEPDEASEDEELDDGNVEEESEDEPEDDSESF